MKRYRRQLELILFLLLLPNLCLGASRQYVLTRSENIRYQSETASGELLQVITRLPKGTVIEVDEADYQDPVTATKFNCDSFDSGPCDESLLKDSKHGFIRNVKIISIPSSTPRQKAAGRAFAQYVAAHPGAELYFSKFSLDHYTRPEREGSGRVLTEPQPVLAGKDQVPEPSAKEPEIADAIKAVTDVTRLSPSAPTPGCPHLAESASWKFEAAASATCPVTPSNLESRLSTIIDQGVPEVPLRRAMEYYVAHCGEIVNRNYLTVVDYDEPSTEPRMYIIDLMDGKVSKELVAHGSRSSAPGDVRYASRFSNRVGSNKSSLGFFITGNSPYYGSRGYSLRVQGINPGINDHAASRDIVIHGSRYVSETYVERNGHIGRSEGCFAIDRGQVRSVISKLKGGSLVYVHHSSLPDRVVAQTASL